MARIDATVRGAGVMGLACAFVMARRGARVLGIDLAPEAAGLLAASLGLSRMYADDLAQLDAGLALYDAFYRWCRDAVEETHDWVSHTPRRRA